MHLHSISAYVDNIVDALNDDARQCLKNLDVNGLTKLNATWGMDLRNKFDLWNPEHPLTKRWHESEAIRQESQEYRGFAYLPMITGRVREGTDYDAAHPEVVSYEIMRGVWLKVIA